MKMKRLKKVVSLVLSVAMVGTLTSIYTKNAHAEEYKYTYGNFEYIVDDLDDAIITKYNGTEKNLVIPSDLEGHMVVKLERGSFKDVKTVTSITIPESVTEIGSECFSGDVSLKDINIPSQVKKIGVLFIAQTQISEVTIPKTIEAMERTYYSNSPFDENIPENAASGAGKLTEIVIPDGVKTIGANAFSDCAKLETVALPESVTEIGSECFNGDVSLKELNIPTHIKKIGVLFIAQTQISEVTIPKTIEAMERTYYSNSPFDESNVKKISFEAGIENNIPENAASGAGKLTEVVIPDGVKIIGANAFSDCAKLENIAIPESVTEIGQSCFEGDSMISEIKLSNGIKTIKSYAFANCEKLGEIVIPSSVESISDGAFINTNSKIYCNYRSESTMNLVESDIDFISSEENDPESNIIDRQNSFYTINANGISINNTIALNVKMTIKDSQKGSGEERTLIIRIPKSTEILFPSIKVNGKYVAESEINYNEDSETLTIPVMEDSVEVTFNVKVSAKEKIKSYAYVTDNDANGKKIIDVIDTINEYFDGLTINAPEISSDKTVHIRGIADKDKTIDLFVNGEKVTSVASKKNGSYEADVEIKHDNNLDKSVIEAKCTDNNGEEISKSTTVIYQEKTPKMTEFELIYYDHYDEEFHCNLLNTNGIVPRIYWYPGLEIKFKAKFENTEQISHIYVTSTKNGIKKSIEAFYDEESGYYITTDAFDTNDYNYIPGAISVEYNNKSYKITNADALEFIESVNKTGGVAEKTKVTYTKKTDTSVEGSVDLSAFSKNDEKLIVDTKAEQIELVNEQDLNNLRQKYQITDKAYKYYQVDENGSETCFETQNLEDGSVSVISYPVYIHGTIEHSVRYSRSSSRSIAGGYNWKVHNYNSSGVTIPFDMEPINDIVSDMDYVPESVKLGVQMLTNHQDYEKLVQEIMQSSDISNKAEAQRMAQDYIIMKQLCAIGLTCFSVACPEMAITNFLLSQISDFAFSEYRKYILGEDLLLSWLIDPSGYIYDEDTKKRINGAKVTAYWIPYDDSEEFWDNKPSLDTYGEVWDGLEYEQLNPIITEVEGKYAWDVPEGWWRVKCEKEGYETVWTDWMPVPPIQTDVNIALKSLYQTVYGDVDNNGKVETADAVLLNKYLAGYSGLDINLEAADTDNNGKIETADTVYLLKYLAGYQIALG